MKNKNIFPNQYGIMMKASDLFIDVDIDEAYKNLLKLKQGYDIRHELLHKAVNVRFVEIFIKTRDMAYIFELILKRLRIKDID
jgi:hypothetical protein